MGYIDLMNAFVLSLSGHCRNLTDDDLLLSYPFNPETKAKVKICLDGMFFFFPKAPWFVNL